MVRVGVGALVALSLIAAPATAANETWNGNAADPRPSAFAGVSVRLPLGQKSAAKPQARLQLTTYSVDSSKPWRTREFSPTGFELGLSRTGKPMLFAGGQNTAEVQRKMGLDRTTTILIVAGVAVAVVVLIAAAGSNSGLGDTCPEYEGSRDHCINP